MSDHAENCEAKAKKIKEAYINTMSCLSYAQARSVDASAMGRGLCTVSIRPVSQGDGRWWRRRACWRVKARAPALRSTEPREDDVFIRLLSCLLSECLNDLLRILGWKSG